MPDIREVLNALSEQDRHLYSHVRTTLRADYIQAVHEVLGVRNWSHEEDSFLDLIDIKIAVLFDRAGRFNSAQGTIDDEAAAKLEQQIVEAAAKVNTQPMTESQKTLEQYAPKPNGDKAVEGWSTGK